MFRKLSEYRPKVVRTSENFRRLAKISEDFRGRSDEILSNFPKISRRFPKLFENYPNTVRRLYERSENFRRLSKISEDFRGRSEVVLTVDQHLLANMAANMCRDMIFSQWGK